MNSNHVTESSLGYYINPLVSVALGAIFFRERMDKWTSWAVGIAGSGVAIGGGVYRFAGGKVTIANTTITGNNASSADNNVSVQPVQ